jgi:urease accessory protein
MFANRIRVRRNPAIEELLKALGTKVTPIEAPFEPEGGAYESHTHHHDHDHAPGHHYHHPD